MNIIFGWHKLWFYESCLSLTPLLGQKQNILLYLGNKLWSLVGREPITWRATKTHVIVTWLDWPELMYTGVHHLDRSQRWSISSALYETTAGSRELFLVRLLIKQWIVRRNNVWRWQQNFEKRNNNYTKVKQNNCCTLWLGSIVLYTLGGSALGFASGVISPPRVYKTQWTPSQRATIV